jgi:YggT family protein
VLAPIRRFMPDLGGLDISPVIAIIALQFIRYLVVYYGVQLI